MTDNDNQPTITLRMLGHDKQWAVMYKGRELTRLHYLDIRPYLLGKRPKSELLARYGVKYEQG